MTRIITAALFAIMATTASAQQNDCAQRSEMVKRLFTTYGETLRGQGLDRRGALVEWFANEESGTWTLFGSTPEGVSCFVSSGQNWEQMAAALPPQGSKS